MKLFLLKYIFSSPDPKGQVSYCHYWVSIVCRPSVKFSHFNQLLWNHWANLNQTLVEWSLDGPLPKLFPVIPTSNQDGRQAKNRKKGGCSLLKMSSNFNCSYMARSSLTYISGFSVKLFFQPIYTDDAIRHILIKDHIMSDPALSSKWLLLLKIEISSIVHCCFSISQNELKF